MKKEYVDSLAHMLQSQLHEEKESYQRALSDHKEFRYLKKIKQRIKSLNDSLEQMEKTPEMEFVLPE